MAASLLVVASGPALASDYFSDVGDDHPFHDEISRLFELGITTGFPVEGDDPEFRPSLPITRQAIIAFVYRAAGEPAGDHTEDFSDIEEGDPFYDAIAWAATNDITSGFSDGTFRPATNVTRQAFTAFLHRLNGAPTGDFSEDFSDVDEGDPFFTAIAWAATNNVVTGFSDGRFRPTTQITRQAVAALLVRYIDNGFEIVFDDQGIPADLEITDLDDLDTDGDEFDVAFDWVAPGDPDGTVASYDLGVGLDDADDVECDDVTGLTTTTGPDGTTDDDTAEASPYNTGGTTTALTLFDFQDGIYCARVRTVYDDASVSLWSDYIPFTIDNATPQDLTLAAGPDDLDTDGDELDVQWSWTGFDQAVSYDLGYGIDKIGDGSCDIVEAVTAEDGVNGASNDGTDDASPYNTTDDGAETPGQQTDITIFDHADGDYCARVRSVLVDGSVSAWSRYEAVTVLNDDGGIPSDTTVEVVDQNGNDTSDLSVAWTAPSNPAGTIVSYDIALANDTSTQLEDACSSTDPVGTDDGVDGTSDDDAPDASPYNTGDTATSDIVFDVPDGDYCLRVRTRYADGTASPYTNFVAVTVGATA